MSTTSVMSPPGAPQWGCLALVTYLPDRLGSFLTGLRQSVDGVHIPEAHITFLPPRALPVPVERASAEIGRLLRPVRPFQVELGSIRVFPNTNILYLDVTIGLDALLNLHSSLNSDGLFSEESFKFTPHLTLSGPLPPDAIEDTRAKAEEAWATSALSPRFLVNEVVVLWQPGLCSERNWTRLASYSLAAYPNSGVSAGANRT